MTSSLPHKTRQHPLRVAFLTPSLHIGGAERWILSMARNFHSVCPAGVVVCAPHTHPAMLEQAARLMPVFLARKVGCANETQRLLKRLCVTADVLISWGVPRLSSVTRELRVPVIDVSHSDGRWGQQTKLVQRACAGADFHVAVSRSALTAFPENVRSSATVIYNGVEVDRITPRRPVQLQRIAWGAADDDKVALFLGRYDDVKQPLRLLSAMRQLPNCWKAVFHGHGPMKQELLAAAASLGKRARILDSISHVGDALAAADVLAMPSRYEGMPLTLIEAWLTGLPTVNTPIGFVQEAINMHGPLCEVVPAEPTGRELADGLIQAFGTPHSELRTQNARRVAWTHYTAAAMAQRWEEYLSAVVDSFGQLSKTDEHRSISNSQRELESGLAPCRELSGISGRT